MERGRVNRSGIFRKRRGVSIGIRAVATPYRRANQTLTNNHRLPVPRKSTRPLMQNLPAIPA
jgi:hypothetical protein